MSSRFIRPMLGAAILAMTGGAALAQPSEAVRATERAVWALSGALGFENQIEACAIPVSESQRDQLRNAIAALQKKIGAPDRMIANIRRDLRAGRSEEPWISIKDEICKDSRTRVAESLAEILAASK